MQLFIRPLALIFLLPYPLILPSVILVLSPSEFVQPSCSNTFLVPYFSLSQRGLDAFQSSEHIRETVIA